MKIYSFNGKLIPLKPNQENAVYEIGGKSLINSII